MIRLLPKTYRIFGILNVGERAPQRLTIRSRARCNLVTNGMEARMVDLREYSFGDWFRVFLRLVPALLLVTVLILLPIALIGAFAWLMTPL
jgi:hypothetical protein